MTGPVGSTCVMDRGDLFGDMGILVAWPHKLFHIYLYHKVTIAELTVQVLLDVPYLKPHQHTEYMNKVIHMTGYTTRE